MIEKCPHCQEKVLFTDTLCPNCGGDRLQPPAQPPAPAAPEGVPKEPDREPSDAWFWWKYALICLAALGFCIDWALVSGSGSIDYRNRITGSRLLAAGEDPYHYKWRPGDPERWCDVYDNPKLPVTKTTVTPTMLVVSMPLGWAAYPASRRAWMILEWAMLAGLWWLWWRRPGQAAAARWWWSAMLVVFAHGLAWRLHLDRGQAYLMWALVLGIWLRLSLDSARGRWWHGLLAGLLVCLRPPLLLVVAPFALWRRRGQLAGMALGVLLGVGAPMVWRPTVWQDYQRAMDGWSEIYRTGHNPRPGTPGYPPVIEGMKTNDIGAFKERKIIDSSVFRPFLGGGKEPLPVYPVLGVLGVLFGVWWWRVGKSADGPVLAGLAAWAFLADAFLPAYRYPYNDVMVLNLLALLPLLGGWARPARALAVGALVAGLWLAYNEPPGFNKYWIYAPTALWAAVALLAVAAAVCNRPPPFATGHGMRK